MPTSGVVAVSGAASGIRRAVVEGFAALLLTLVGFTTASAEPLRLMHDVGNAVAQYMADGTPDQSFNSNGLVAVHTIEQTFANALALQSDGKVVLAGSDSDLTTGSVAFGLTRYQSDGHPDASFGAGGLVRTRIGERDGEGRAVAVQPDGKLIEAGTAFGQTGNDDQFGLARFNIDGSLDTSFGSAGVVSTAVGATSAQGNSLVLQSDGKIVVVGTAFLNGSTDDDFAVVRYMPDGALDSSFGSGGVVTTDFSLIEPGANAPIDHAYAVALQPDGKIVAVGSTGLASTDFALVRYNTDGSLDPTFGSRGMALGGIGNEAAAYAVALQEDGCIVAAGSADRMNPHFIVARYRPDGSPDTSFGGKGSVAAAFQGGSGGAHAVVIQPDGSIVVGGSGYAQPTSTDADVVGGFAVLRYRSDGVLDTTFGNAGTVLTSVGDAGGAVNALGMWPDGRIVAAGLANFRAPQTR